MGRASSLSDRKLRTAWVGVASGKVSFRLGGGRFLNASKNHGVLEALPNSIGWRIASHTMQDKLFAWPPWMLSFLFGRILRWEADILLLNQPHDPSNCSALWGPLLSEYDIAIFNTESADALNTSLTAPHCRVHAPMPDSTVHLLAPDEPSDEHFRMSARAWSLYAEQHHLCPVLLDYYDLKNTLTMAIEFWQYYGPMGLQQVGWFTNLIAPLIGSKGESAKLPNPMVTWLFLYPVQSMREVVDWRHTSRDARLLDGKVGIYIGARSIDDDETEQWAKQLGWKVVVNNHAEPMSWVAYLRALAACRYGVALDLTASAGQLFAEAAIFGLPMFGFGHKLFARELFPSLMLLSRSEADPWGEIRKRIETLEAGPEEFYTELSQNISWRAQEFLGTDSGPETMLSHVSHASKHSQGAQPALHCPGKELLQARQSKSLGEPLLQDEL